MRHSNAVTPPRTGLFWVCAATAAALLELDEAPIHPDAREGLADLAQSIAWRAS